MQIERKKTIAVCLRIFNNSIVYFSRQTDKKNIPLIRKNDKRNILLNITLLGKKIHPIE